MKRTPVEPPVVVPPVVEEPVVEDPVVEPVEVVIPEVVPDTIVPVPCPEGQWRLYTNAPAWAAAVTNIAAEYDFHPLWSANLYMGWSAWNYGHVVRKFRTSVFRPEIRRWFRCGHEGVYVEGHLTAQYYNVALPSWRYRIQDRGAHSPALGGGVGAGYRLNLGGSGHWALEGSLGVGGYWLRYDRFLNERNGRKVDTRERGWFGVDHVALSVVYTINPPKK